MNDEFALSERKRLLADLCALIAVDSSNPPGNELDAAALVRDCMADFGADCTLQEIAPDRANAICRLPFSRPEKGPVLIFNSHMDVVPRGDTEWTYPPFEPTTVDGRVYGRGATDAKGSLAAMIAGIRMALKTAKDLQGELILTAVAAEETGGLGTQYWIDHRETDGRPCMAVVGEPTGLVPMIGHKGVSRRRVMVRGRSAHASRPSQGVNAIYPAAHLAVFIEGLNRRLAEKSDPLLGNPVVSANVIRGGVKDNVIPDYCELQIDRRMIPGEDTNQIDREIDEWKNAMASKAPWLDCRVEVIGADKEPVIVSRDEPVVQFAVDAVKEVTGREETPKGLQGATDMTFLVHKGKIPTVIFGPGHMEQTHVVNEFVEIEALEIAARVYAGLITKVLG
jgi:acetylornithine deacetylase/succinyl-diaminopimelate desuccinylase family protein